MSTIEKLSVRGIRSFGTEAEDEQKLTFSSPLTLILGANGCGKTTIIECLKYALTGEMPPGCNKGQSFVHDPKLFNSSECLGQVKLQVRNLRSNALTVTRSMRTSVKKGAGLKFETLDSTIHIEINGKTESISKRCVDTNVEMAHAMGVSKAIINNVLFCHQEDSSWPLDEGKKLKEKFDEIFGTTEYNKTIDKLIKMRKTCEGQVKLKDNDLKHLEEIKKDSDKKRLELQTAEERRAKLQIKFDNFDEELKPIKERLMKIKTIEMEIGKLQGEKVAMSTKLDKCRDHQTKLTSELKSIFDGSMIMLDREIRLFKERTEERKKNLKEFECELKSIKINEQNIQSKLTEMERKRGTLLYQRQQEQDLVSERANHMKGVAERLDVTVDSDLENSNENIDDTMKRISAAVKREEDKLKELSQNHDKIDQEMQSKIDSLREQKASLDSAIASKRKQAEELKKDQVKHQREIDQVEKSAQMLKQLTSEIDKLDQTYAEYKNTVDLDEMKKTIGEKRTKRNHLQEQLDKCDEQMNFLNSFSQITAQIAAKESHLENRESEVKKIKNKHADNLRRLLNNETIETNYKRRLQTIYQNLQREITDLNKTINRNQQSITQFDMMRKTQRDELNRVERELQDGSEQIYEQCHSTPFTEVLDRIKENIARFQFEHGTLKSAEVLYKKYIQKMEGEPCCPLCHKDMNSNEVTDLTTELQDEIRRLPENIERAERTLKNENRKYELLLALQPVTEKIEKLKIDIPQLKQKLKSTEEKLSNARNDQESYQMSLAEPNINLELTNSMLGDMSILDEAIRDVTRIKQELVDIKSKLPNRSSTLSMEEAQLERSTVAAELKSETKDIDILQTKYDQESEMMNSLREKRNSLKDRQIKLQEGVQALTQLKARHREISTQLDEMIKNITELFGNSGPISQELKLTMTNKENTRTENRNILKVAMEKLNESRRITSEIKRCEEEICKLAALNLVNAIHQLEINLKKALSDQKEKKKENEDISQKINELRKEIASQESTERNLRDNKELKNLKNEESELQTRLDDLTKDMGDLDFRSVAREKESLIEKENKITETRGKFVGQMGELTGQLEKLDKELKEPKYQNAIKNFCQVFNEYFALKKAVSDLGRYRMVLEWALLKYHQEKMEKVNRLIRELWRSIYRGNDIDYIQIKTDENKTHSADKKRSYDYRVVQSKHDIELDMRGRCSAGQRVLACLVIRIALAETFSSSCGVLALDEPTTNLDRANITSLCDALNKIVEERQTQSNFMLLVITHDEEFIETLGRIMHYYKVSRNDDGKSVISKIKVY